MPHRHGHGRHFDAGHHGHHHHHHHSGIGTIAAAGALAGVAIGGTLAAGAIAGAVVGGVIATSAFDNQPRVMNRTVAVTQYQQPIAVCTPGAMVYTPAPQQSALMEGWMVKQVIAGDCNSCESS